MIYIFTHIGVNNKTTVHKFYHDGKIYMHDIKSNTFHVDCNYKDMSTNSQDIPKFDYTLPDILITHHETDDDIDYTTITDMYVTKAIFNNI